MPTRRALIGSALAATFLAGCSKVDTLGIDSEPTLDFPPPSSAGKPLKLTELSGVTVPRNAQLAEGLVAVVGESIAVTDLTNGKELWSTTTKDWEKGLPENESIIGREVALTRTTRPLLVVDTYVNPCPGNAGICHDSQTDRTEARNALAIDARTGKMAWKAPVVPAALRATSEGEQWDDANAKIVGGRGSTVLVAVKRKDDIRTVALDADTGRTLWTREGAYPAYIGETSVVVGVRWTEQRPLVGISSMRVLDLKTGKDVPISGLPHGVDGTLAGESATHLADDVVLMRGTGKKSVWALDLRRRTVVAGPGNATVVGRSGDKVLFAALAYVESSDQGRSLVTFAEGEPRVSVAKLAERDVTLRAVHAGAIWTATIGGSSTAVLDRSGRTIATLDGELVDLVGSVCVTGTKAYKIS